MKEIEDVHYKSAFYKMVDAIVIIDASSGSIVDINKSCRQLLGYEKSELVGKHITDLFAEDTTSENEELIQGTFMYGAWMLLITGGVTSPCSTKVAVTEISLLTDIDRGLALELRSPDQPEKTQPESATAVRVSS